MSECFYNSKKITPEVCRVCVIRGNCPTWYRQQEKPIMAERR